MKKRSKGKKRLRLDKFDRAFDRLAKAVANWLRVHGGYAVVCGPSQIITWPGDDGQRKFTVAIPVLGKRPTTRAVGSEKR